MPWLKPSHLVVRLSTRGIGTVFEKLEDRVAVAATATLAASGIIFDGAPQLFAHEAPPLPRTGGKTPAAPPANSHSHKPAHHKHGKGASASGGQGAASSHKNKNDNGGKATRSGGPSATTTLTSITTPTTTTIGGSNSTSTTTSNSSSTTSTASGPTNNSSSSIPTGGKRPSRMSRRCGKPNANASQNFPKAAFTSSPACCCRSGTGCRPTICASTASRPMTASA